MKNIKEYDIIYIHDISTYFFYIILILSVSNGWLNPFLAQLPKAANFDDPL